MIPDDQFQSIASEVRALVEGAHEIVISGHTSPDGDALGSGLGLGLGLANRWPEKRVVNLLADEAQIPKVYAFLPHSDRFVPSARYDGVPDLAIAVDSPGLDRINASADVFRRAKHVVALDHHPLSAPFAELDIRDTSAASASMIVYRLLREMGAPITPEVATCLFCGLVTDTGRFQYQNADAAAFHVASRLVASGAVPSNIALHVYQSKRLAVMRLESVVMSRIRTTCGDQVAYSYAYADDLKGFGVDKDECDGLVDIVRQVEGVRTCLFLRQDGPEEVRGNLRSKCELDISGIARALGGGGHPAASGFTFHGTVDEAVQTVVPMLEELVRKG